MAPGSQRKRKRRRIAKLSQIGRPDAPLPTEEAHIRLLEIKSGDSDAPIECLLSVHKLAKAPTYSAVSYVCGDPTPKKLIVINGNAVEVGLNCHYVLKLLRTLESRALAKFYWIDALCINQGDLDEKSSQIRLMGPIFNTARQVLACVGPHSEDSRDFIDNVRTISNECDSIDGNWDVDDSNDDEWKSSKSHQAWISSYSWSDLAKFFIAAYHFAQRPYWDRLWIVQELVLAQRIVLVCGLDTVPWWPLPKLFVTDLADALHTHFWNHRADQYAFRAREAFRKITDTKVGTIASARLNALAGESNRSLRNLVVNFRSWQCTEPLDRIYGLLHLFDKKYEVMAQIIPDYTKSILSLAIQCLGLLSKVDERLNQFFLSDVVDLAEALELTMHHPEISKLAELRQQHHLELCTLDGADVSMHSAAAKSTALQLAADAKERVDGYVIINMNKAPPIPVEQLSDCEIMSEVSENDKVRANIEAFCAAAMSHATQAEQPASTSNISTQSGLKLLRNCTHAPGILCGRAQPGDYYVRFNKVVGHIAEEFFMPCLILRRCGSSTLFEIVGQGFIPDHGVLSRYADRERSSAFKIYFEKEDFMAFACSDLGEFDLLRKAKLADRDLGGRTVARGFRQELRTQRLFTAVVSRAFSSFAVETGSGINQPSP